VQQHLNGLTLSDEGERPMMRPTPVTAVNDAEQAPPEQPPHAEPEGGGPQPPPATEKPATPPPLTELFNLDPALATDEQIQDCVNRQVAIDVEKSGLTTQTIVVLHDDHSMSRFAADRIYDALTKSDRAKPILLILNSTGGDVAAAYLIAKLCREHTIFTFEVAVPRRAKSAATLICCGADKIHMGSLSELGPIDPQFGAIPALALKHSVEHIAELAGRYPGASGMFSDYLAKSLRIEALGYFERVAESAAQYAVRLLQARTNAPKDRDNDAIAQRLVYSYKDHGFVIDSREAAEIFGQAIIVSDSKEYRLANALFGTLDLAAWFCARRFAREFSYIGGQGQGCFVWKKSQ
jgi:Serine dehydrogenase proteinase